MNADSILTVGDSRIALRIVNEADLPFLRAVYASTREQELAAVPWSPADKLRFIQHQFHAQDTAYRTNYPGAQFFIITVDGVDAGRLYLHPTPDDLLIMDIALLPVHCGRGIGSALLRAILDEAQRDRRTVSIHVETFNPARRLYERLGFRHVSTESIYQFLRWSATPEGGPPAAPIKPGD